MTDNALRKPALLVILDGVGIAEDGPGNAVSQSDAPFLHLLFSDTVWPCRTLEASGPAVGLPDGQMGNSEVGHLNIGAGRIVAQELTRIDNAVSDGSLAANPVLLAAFANCCRPGARLHLIGMLSDGGVHSSYQHMQAIAEAAADYGVSDLALHAFLDGRDVSPTSGSGYLEQAERFLADLANRHPGLTCGIASVSGRYWAMDRDNRWERIEPAWQTMVHPAASGNLADTTDTASELVRQSYNQGVTDEFVKPFALDERGIADDDVVVFFNFRPDRARQLTRAFIEPGFSGFSRQPVACEFVTLTEYDPLFLEWGARVLFAKYFPENVLADHIASLELRQLHIAETEKYAHVTFFFNGGVEQPKPNEQRILTDSPKVATYDLKPEMSAAEVTATLLSAIENNAADLYIVNFANGDMVGHTGIFSAARAAVEFLDQCLNQLVDAIMAADGVVVVTADHGNAEQMLDTYGQVWTAHSLNPVPFVVISAETQADPDGSGLPRRIDLDRSRLASLADIAPTLLDLMQLPIPAEFTGTSLLVR